jgi:SAM-dependent methyltransferase
MKDQYRQISESFRDARQAPATTFLEAPSFIAAVGDVSDTSVIDFACGEGYYTRLLKKRGAASVLGVDLSPQMIDLAREQERQEPLGVDYAVGDAARMGAPGAPGAPGPFDLATAVFLFNYAETVETLNAMLETVAANLTRDGRLVAVVPNPDFVNGRRDTLPYGYYLDEIGRFPSCLRTRMTFTGDAPFSIEFTQWDRRTYETALAQAGFRDICWTHFTVTADGVEKLGAAFWQATLENPKSLILSARKA